MDDTFEIVDLSDNTLMADVSTLFDIVWQRGPGDATLMSPEVLTAIAYAGGQVSAAYIDGTLAGATAAFLGRDGDRIFLHSHITGVHPEAAGQHVGSALKWHQFRWCMTRGIRWVRWTFDPLIRRNAWFNIGHLGALPVRYERDVYGRHRTRDGHEIGSDRLLVEWDLHSPRVHALSTGRSAQPDIQALRRTGALCVLEIGEGLEPLIRSETAPRMLVQIPPDIELLRRVQPVLATKWAHAIEQVLASHLRGGATIRGFHREGYYLLSTSSERR